jgi:DNA invertase Pin-like site-specific DNA recombinase
VRSSERPRGRPLVRCAIYTRKSSDEGLEQEFNSLDAQREACAAFIVSQRHAGWAALSNMYDDGGFSGGTMERPALLRLLDDVKARRINVVVVYKVDRLTRSLADFAKIVEVLDAHDASFVSVTRQLNTTTSMGRLTLNMLLSFAQFEREIAGERIRDKIAASKAKGMWMGGNVPLGYEVKERKLIVNEAEAKTVRLIFRRYGELGSVTLLREELNRKGIVSKRRRDKSGRCAGGGSFARGALYTMLQNRLYRGEIVHKGTAYPGQHQAIIDAELWQTVEETLAVNRHARAFASRAQEPSLLSGLLIDAHGHRMTPTHAVKSSRRYRYYVSTPLISCRRSALERGRRVPAGEIEGLVRDRLRSFLASPKEISDALAPLDLAAPMQHVVIENSARLAGRWAKMPAVELRRLVRSVVEQVTVEDEQIFLQLDRQGILSSLMGNAPSEQLNNGATDDPMVLTIEASLRRAGRGLRLVIGNGTAQKTDPALVKLIGRAVAIRNELLSGRDESIDAMARRLGAKRDHLTVLVRLSYLAPNLVRAILEGRHPVALTPKRLAALSKDLPHSWDDQRQYLGFATE